MDKKTQEKIMADDDFAIGRLIEQPFMIKRPILVQTEEAIAGFKNETWNASLWFELNFKIEVEKLKWKVKL